MRSASKQLAVRKIDINKLPNAVTQNIFSFLLNNNADILSAIKPKEKEEKKKEEEKKMEKKQRCFQKNYYRLTDKFFYLFLIKLICLISNEGK